eukprot:6195908-Pleurochrysis_carterae.AAC.4
MECPALRAVSISCANRCTTPHVRIDPTMSMDPRARERTVGCVSRHACKDALRQMRCARARAFIGAIAAESDPDRAETP